MATEQQTEETQAPEVVNEEELAEQAAAEAAGAPPAADAPPKRRTERSNAFAEQKALARAQAEQIRQQTEVNRQLAAQLAAMQEGMERIGKPPAPDPRAARLSKIKEAASRMTADPSTHEDFFGAIGAAMDETSAEAADRAKREAIEEAAKLARRAAPPPESPPDLAAVEREFPWMRRQSAAVESTMDALVAQRGIDYDSLDRSEKIAILREAAAKYGSAVGLPRMGASVPRGAVAGAPAGMGAPSGASDPMSGAMPHPTPAVMMAADIWKKAQPNNKQIQGLSDEALFRTYVTYLRKRGDK